MMILFSWLDSGRITARKAAQRRQTMTGARAGHMGRAQVGSPSVTLYGSEGWGFESIRSRPIPPVTAGSISGLGAARAGLPLQRLVVSDRATRR